MLIKKAKYKNVRITSRKCISREVYGCDECYHEICEFPNEAARLEVTVFQNPGAEATTLHFCSWACVLKHLPKIKCSYFASLPYMYFDETKPFPRTAKALTNILTVKEKRKNV
ncbi:MAG: hypothetical protein WC886_07915 [Saccharofermentanaceae bacterium]